MFSVVLFVLRFGFYTIGYAFRVYVYVSLVCVIEWIPRKLVGKVQRAKRGSVAVF